MGLTPESPDLQRSLQRGLEELDLRLSEDAQRQLVLFIELLCRWNRTYNLTGIRNPSAMVSHHLLDSLTLLPFLKDPLVLDIGSGAGVPGIPLAIARPDLRFGLLEANGKKARFMEYAIMVLDLGASVEVIHSRVEQYRPERTFSALTARAFGNLASLVRPSAHLCSREGEFLAMKGGYPEAELREIPSGFEIARVHRLKVPGLEAQRHLVRLRPSST